MEVSILINIKGFPRVLQSGIIFIPVSITKHNCNHKAYFKVKFSKNSPDKNKQTENIMVT